MKDIFSSVEFWKFALPLFGAILAWFVNEWRKRVWEQYQRKESNYKELVRCLKGFYVGAGDADRLKAEFLDQLNQCWLYCPDEVRHPRQSRWLDEQCRLKGGRLRLL